MFLATINPVAAAPFFFGEFIGATAGGISAWQQGGDVGRGVLFGTVVGGATGGLSMGFKNYMLGTAYAELEISAFEGGLITAGEFAIGGFGFGLIEGYAGGARSWEDAFGYALRGAAIGAGMGFAAGYSYTAGWQDFFHGADIQKHNRSVFERMKNGLKVSFSNAIEKYKKYIARMELFNKSRMGKFIKSVTSGATSASRSGIFSFDPGLSDFKEYYLEMRERELLKEYSYSFRG